MSSGVSPGYVLRMASSDHPCANKSTMNSTASRVPFTTGFPARISGFSSIRSCQPTARSPFCTTGGASPHPPPPRRPLLRPRPARFSALPVRYRSSQPPRLPLDIAYALATGVAAGLQPAPLLEADEPPLPNDHMVQNVDAEQLGSLGGVLNSKSPCGSTLGVHLVLAGRG